MLGWARGLEARPYRLKPESEPVSAWARRAAGLCRWPRPPPRRCWVQPGPGSRGRGAPRRPLIPRKFMSTRRTAPHRAPSPTPGRRAAARRPALKLNGEGFTLRTLLVALAVRRLGFLELSPPPGCRYSIFVDSSLLLSSRDAVSPFAKRSQSIIRPGSPRKCRNACPAAASAAQSAGRVAMADRKARRSPRLSRLPPQVL